MDMIIECNGKQASLELKVSEISSSDVCDVSMSISNIGKMINLCSIS